MRWRRAAHSTVTAFAASMSHALDAKNFHHVGDVAIFFKDGGYPRAFCSFYRELRLRTLCRKTSF
jgi:hypothetical protein